MAKSQQSEGAKEVAKVDTAAAMESARGEPMVKRFLEVFRGDLAQVKPVKGEES